MYKIQNEFYTIRDKKNSNSLHKLKSTKYNYTSYNIAARQIAFIKIAIILPTYTLLSLQIYVMNAISPNLS